MEGWIIDYLIAQFSDWATGWAAKESWFDAAKCQEIYEASRLGLWSERLHGLGYRSPFLVVNCRDVKLSTHLPSSDEDKNVVAMRPLNLLSPRSEGGQLQFSSTRCYGRNFWAMHQRKTMCPELNNILKGSAMTFSSERPVETKKICQEWQCDSWNTKSTTFKHKSMSLLFLDTS